LSPLKSDVLGTVRQEAGPWPKALKTKLSHGGHQTQAHSEQIVLMMARWEATPHEKRTKGLKRDLESYSKKPSELVGKLA
jgi:hypothetical protein